MKLNKTWKIVIGLSTIWVALGIGAFYMPYLALPIYYLIYIWPESSPEWALAKGSDVE